ncbi:MAG: hypothetical protein AABX40_02055 [Candidatus Hydrothermarchaeota archaeon]
MIALELLEGLADIAKTRSRREAGGYVVAHATFEVGAYDEVLGRLEQAVKPYREAGEEIACAISSGHIIDSGVVQYAIRRGAAMEIYDYRTNTVAFLRLYHLEGGGKEWLALYIDENPSTPWWSEEERRG